MPKAHSIRSIRVWTNYKKQIYNRFSIFSSEYRRDVTACGKFIQKERKIWPILAFPPNKCLFRQTPSPADVEHLCRGYQIMFHCRAHLAQSFSAVKVTAIKFRFAHFSLSGRIRFNLPRSQGVNCHIAVSSTFSGCSGDDFYPGHLSFRRAIWQDELLSGVI